MIEQTLVLIKPDGVLKGIVGEVIQRFERVGMKIVAIKMIKAQREALEKHYFKDDEWCRKVGEKYQEKMGADPEKDPIQIGRNVVEGLILDMQVAPIIGIVLEGHNAVMTVKRLTGPTNIDDAAPGTIRGDFSHDTFQLANVSNRPNLTIIHATDDPKESQKEIDFWFSPNEIHSYSRPEEQVHYRKRD